MYNLITLEKTKVILSASFAIALIYNQVLLPNTLIIDEFAIVRTMNH